LLNLRSALFPKASYNGFRQALAIAVIAGLGSSGCGGVECCDPFAEVYYAVAYGTVTQNGVAAADVEVAAEVFTAVCPVAGAPASNTQARSGAGGAYRVLLASSSPAEGQCLRLTIGADGQSVSRTLTEMPFSTQSSTQILDSVRIDLELP
jgi:hypothetical protein